ncbi:MAG TPA: stage VI sporulation protein F [Bacilli bacterium]
MGYQQYGISSELVERVKHKMKNEAVKERIKSLLDGITKTDLQNRLTVKKLVERVSKVLGESLSDAEAQRIINFTIEQKINPNNTFHLIKLWGMFR